MADALLIPQFEQDLSDYALKSYVDSAVANKDVGVTTFNGRTGAVSPQSGDYTYSMVGAASSGHGHSGTYADYSHTHNYAAANHTHSYAASNHTHDYAASNHTHSVTGTSHTHTGYASSTHSHSENASSSHTHSGYASSTHTHSYASSSHTHSGYASSSHTHSASDISGLSSGGGSFEVVQANWIDTGLQPLASQAHLYKHVFSTPVKMLMFCDGSYTNPFKPGGDHYATHASTSPYSNGWPYVITTPHDTLANDSQVTSALSSYVLTKDGKTFYRCWSGGAPASTFFVWH